MTTSSAQRQQSHPGPTVRDAPGPGSSTSLKSMKAGLAILRLGPVVMLLALAIAFSILSPYFFTFRNLQNLGTQSAIVGALALGQLLVILVRGIDISVGSTLALSTVTVAALQGVGLTNGIAQVFVFLGVGAAMGTLNALLIVKGRIPQPLVVTVATLGIGAGLALLVSGGQEKTGVSDLVQQAGGGFLGPIPIPVILVLVAAAFLAVFTKRTQWGGWIYAVGGDPGAAARLGVPRDRVLMSCYILCGTLAGFAGLIYSGRTEASSPLAGAGMELNAVTAVIIGGASLFGGRGSVGNVLIGALIIGVITNGLQLIGVPVFWQAIAVGIVILLALELDVVRRGLETKVRVILGRISRA